MGRSPNLSIIDHWTTDTALEVLQIARKREEAAEEENGDRNQVGNGSRVSATDQDKTVVNKAGQPLAPIDNTLKISVRNAIEESGLIPRDVYSGIFDAYGIKDRHSAAVRIQLREIVESFSMDRGPGFEKSHKVV